MNLHFFVVIYILEPAELSPLVEQYEADLDVNVHASYNRYYMFLIEIFYDRQLNIIAEKLNIL